MQSQQFEQLLEKAASACGIDPGFWDIWGRYHHTAREAKQAILCAMGLPAVDAAGLTAALAERTRREWERLAPPAVVAVECGLVVLLLHVRVEALGEAARICIRQEDGQTSEHVVHLNELPQTASIAMDGRTWVRKRVEIPIHLPLGYHEIVVEAGAERGVTRYIVTPERAFVPPHLGRGGRTAGLAISLYGVRSARNWGCGDFTDLRDIVDWVADELGASFVALNPLHAIHNRRPYNNSPYLPNSTFYQNFLYLDVERIDDFDRCRRARQLRRSDAIERELDELRHTEYVDYERAAALKLRFLKLLFIQFLRDRRSQPERAREFDLFVEREGDLLEKFATYCALDEHVHKRNPDIWLWTEWPEPYRDPESEETRAFRRKHWRAVMFYQYVQWQIDMQLRAAHQRARGRRLSIGLYHDLALATDRFGSDLWAHRSFYVDGCRVGSPPDDFSPQGQDWSFPPPNAERHREDGYRLFAETIRKNCRYGGALRIDHVMRLFRLYWIPEGSDATQGAYVREVSEDFVRIVALESVRNQVMVVGEDLGTVEPVIRETLARIGILSYRLLYFEKNGHGGFRPYDEYPKHALVASTTHDLPTITGFWLGSDIEARRHAGLVDEEGFRAQTEQRINEKQKMLDVLFQHALLPKHFPATAQAYPELTGELHHAIAGFLALTPSQLWAINQEDLTKETAQQNLPGSTWQYPNWSRKMRFSLDQLRNDPQARSLSAMLRDWIVNSGRQNRDDQSGSME